MSDFDFSGFGARYGQPAVEHRTHLSSRLSATAPAFVPGSFCQAQALVVETPAPAVETPAPTVETPAPAVEAPEPSAPHDESIVVPPPPDLDLQRKRIEELECLQAYEQCLDKTARFVEGCMSEDMYWSDLYMSYLVQRRKYFACLSEDEKLRRDQEEWQEWFRHASDEEERLYQDEGMWKLSEEHARPLREMQEQRLCEEELTSYGPVYPPKETWENGVIQVVNGQCNEALRKLSEDSVTGNRMRIQQDQDMVEDLEQRLFDLRTTRVVEAGDQLRAREQENMWCWLIDATQKSMRTIAWMEFWSLELKAERRQDQCAASGGGAIEGPCGARRMDVDWDSLAEEWTEAEREVTLTT